MSKLLSRAIALASHYHAEQLDFSGEPYILHPLRVMNAVRAAGFKELYQACAVLHDTLEDTKMTIQEVPVFEGYVGDRERLIRSLYAITRQKDEVYRDYFLRCVDDPVARIVKYYDLLDNSDPKRFHPKAPYERYQKGLRWYHERSEFWALPISLEELEIARDPIPF